MTIRPGVGMLGLLSSMNYKPWYALSEFVDNALSSWLANAEVLRAAGVSRCVVRITLDSGLGQIVVHDNAAGIAASDIDRAFKSAEPPPDSSGLSQFGIGMKAAACWYAKKFTVTTSALGEPTRRTVDFDMPAILDDNREELPVRVNTARAQQHGTTIILAELHRPIPAGRTLGKIRAYLGSIYRSYLEDDLEIWVKDEQVAFRRPSILVRPRWDADPGDDEIEWCKQLELGLPNGGVARGWAALRESGSTRQAGLALLYRRKVVVGAGSGANESEDHYRPAEIFGSSNSFVSQRLFGEIDLSGMRVTHSKDAILWDGFEDDFISELRRQLDAEPLPMLRMAQQYRVTERGAAVGARVESAVESTATAAAQIKVADDGPLDDPPIEREEPDAGETAAQPAGVHQRFTIPVVGEQLTLELVVSDRPLAAWIRVEDYDGFQRIELNRDHPFMRSFAHLPNQEIEPVLRLAAGIGIAELLARRGGVRGASQVRLRLNELLNGPLGRSELNEIGEDAP